MGSIVEQEEQDQFNNSTHNNNYKIIESNWVITNGSFTNSITVESSDYPLPEPDSDDPTHKSPLVLQPLLPDSGPCEIKLSFERKYEISQIYVRSSARVYEVYYAKSDQSSNEYLCTVRCGVAERDDKVLQAVLVNDVSGESGGSVGGASVNSDDDWVNIKCSESEVGRSSFSDDTSSSSNKGKNTQDLYEATAEINDVDPCSSLTIRLLSLQDKSHVYVDEVYVYVDPADSTDSETLVPAPTSSQSPLMAMFMPTLMQLTATGLYRAKDKLASDQSQKDDNARKDQVDPQYFNSTTESVEVHQPQLACNAHKCGESREVNDIPLGRLERSLEQLLSRVSAVEDICLRFEEKMLKPIQSMEARLQHVENKLETGLKQIENKLEIRLQHVELQMEKFSNIHYSDFPRCTRISAPAFSRSESNSSSFYNEGRNLTVSKEPEMEKKDLLCIRPGLVVTVPEFSCGEDEEDNSEQKELEDTACTVPNKTLSVDDALAAALTGFLSTAKIQHVGNVEKDSSISNENKEVKHFAIVESCQVEAQLSGAEDSMKESLSYTQILSITAPDFTVEEIGDDDEFVNHNRPSSDVALGYENYGNDQVLSVTATGLTAEEISDDGVVSNYHSSNETALGSDNDTTDPELKKFLPSIQDKSLFTSAESCDLNINESVNELESETNGNLSSGEVHLNGICTNLVESSHSSSLDFNYPILEVEFTSDEYASLNNPLEALLEGEMELNVQPVYDGSVHSDNADDGNTDQVNVVSCGSNGTTEHFLIDIGCHAAGSFNLVGGLENSSTAPGSPEMTQSLI